MVDIPRDLGQRILAMAHRAAALHLQLSLEDASKLNPQNRRQARIGGADPGARVSLGNAVAVNSTDGRLPARFT